MIKQTGATTQVDPLYVVMRQYGNHRICMRDERGVYRPVVVLQKPYDNNEAASALCHALNTLGLEIMMDDPKDTA